MESFQAQQSVLDRVAAGDAAAVDDCVQQYGGLVWSVARRLSVNLADAEDAVQEVFIEVWKSAHRFDASIASEATFIATIARRRLIDRRRRRGRQLDTAPFVEDMAPPAATEPDRVEISDEAARAKKGLQQLRPEERRVLELSIYHGLSHQNIADATQLPLGTVKTHARRGLIRLREMLGVESPAAANGGAKS